MSDLYAELRQAIVALKQKYPELFYRPGGVVCWDDDDCLITYSGLGQHPVGIVDNDGRFWRHGMVPMYATDGVWKTYTPPNDSPIGIVTAVDNVSKMVDVLIGVTQ